MRLILIPLMLQIDALKIDFDKSIFTPVPESAKSNEEAISRWLELYELEAKKVYRAGVLAGWNYFTNVSQINRMDLVSY